MPSSLEQAGPLDTQAGGRAPFLVSGVRGSEDTGSRSKGAPRGSAAPGDLAL